MQVRVRRRPVLASGPAAFRCSWQQVTKDAEGTTGADFDLGGCRGTRDEAFRATFAACSHLLDRRALARRLGGDHSLGSCTILNESSIGAADRWVENRRSAVAVRPV